MQQNCIYAGGMFVLADATGRNVYLSLIWWRSFVGIYLWIFLYSDKCLILNIPSVNRFVFTAFLVNSQASDPLAFYMVSLWEDKERSYCQWVIALHYWSLDRRFALVTLVCLFVLLSLCCCPLSPNTDAPSAIAERAVRSRVHWPVLKITFYHFDLVSKVTV